MSAALERPSVLVVAEFRDALNIESLFARRGFAVVVTPSLAALRSYFDRGGDAPSAAVVDFSHPDSRSVLATFEDQEPRPVLVGILPSDGVPVQQDLVDATFERPVDRARLFVCVVELVALRKKGRRRRKLTGIVGAIDGNDLFAAVARELAVAVPAVNASAVLEASLRRLGTGPFISKKADFEALLASGRLAAALAPFGTSEAIAKALTRVVTLLSESRMSTRPASSPAERATQPIARLGTRFRSNS
jgi:hypothetical protein